MRNERRIFDWKSRHDERSRNYPVTSLFGAPPDGHRKRRMWYPPITLLDQGQEGACVGFAWAIELLGSPNRVRLGADGPADAFARKVYRNAQKIDEWPGENYEGTSILAGAKVVQQLGFIESYYWAFGVEQVIETLLTLGPVVVGIPWYASMYETDDKGLVEVSGPWVGGHAITLTGYSRRRFHSGMEDVIRWRNSWGSSYGLRGTGYIRVNDLANLLSQNGEACVPTGRRTERVI